MANSGPARHHYRRLRLLLEFIGGRSWNIQKVCLIYRNKEYAVDGIRSALGLAVENMYAYGVVMDTEIEKT